jgi:uncharacterized membrane-anchored protein YhcB (DUF1043 family)
MADKQNITCEVFVLGLVIGIIIGEIIGHIVSR